MTQKRPVSTKALSAYLRSCHTSLSAAVAMVGLDQECIGGETISDDILGRIARFRGTTPEQLAELAERYA
jgi:hypothetical protein